MKLGVSHHTLIDGNVQLEKQLVFVMDAKAPDESETKKGGNRKPSRNRDQISRISVPTSSVRKSNQALSSPLAGVQGECCLGLNGS